MQEDRQAGRNEGKDKSLPHCQCCVDRQYSRRTPGWTGRRETVGPAGPSFRPVLQVCAHGRHTHTTQTYTHTYMRTNTHTHTYTRTPIKKRGTTIKGCVHTQPL